jgi:hypothetical protein
MIREMRCGRSRLTRTINLWDGVMAILVGMVLATMTPEERRSQ